MPPTTTTTTTPFPTTPAAPGDVERYESDLEPCRYSLFDVKRGKYLITDWTLAELVTQAKVKKWCSKPKEYMVFHSPYVHCQRYYRDLCHVSLKMIIQ